MIMPFWAPALNSPAEKGTPKKSLVHHWAYTEDYS